MNLGRLFVISANVFQEVIRDRVLYLIAFFAIFLAAANQLIPWVAAGEEDRILLDLGIAAIGALGLVVIVFVGTGLVNKEIEKRTVLVILSKPISRAEFIFGKHLGLSAVVAVLVLATTAIYFLILTLNHISYPIVSLIVAVLYLFLELSLITAVAIVFGVFTSPLLATLMTFAIYLMGHLSQDIVALAALSKNPQMQAIIQKFYLILPDLSRLNLRNEAVYGVIPDPMTLAASAGYALLYTLLLLLLASLIFSRRQF
ncbi:ABC transporter permease [Trichothermofontia sichuanensis B231]|uniref:ABC transporter permease n=1 Tax=Trichothermofontia sichuanensis TaxID=3045816 RepID=UPI00224746D0|nr:ABC transporter permease [Trichothermofontia sichuanensis]UZQ55668.1 ABC transporter permease [Trichothermofontia sichuanensis B231]